MTIVLSCGHEVKDFDQSHYVRYKSIDREGNRAVAIALFCDVCEDKLRQDNDILDSEDAATHWMGDE